MPDNFPNLFTITEEAPLPHLPMMAYGSGLRDNHHRGSVASFLREKIATSCEISVVSAYFTIYAYAALAQELDNIHEMRFLFGEPKFVSALDPEKTDKKAFQI